MVTLLNFLGVIISRLVSHICYSYQNERWYESGERGRRPSSPLYVIIRDFKGFVVNGLFLK